ncbi:MAG: signal peptidase II [Robiginitomaculum sp.]|nr:MAG: signal peptidase II [Robiginitomaculum sp.]
MAEPTTSRTLWPFGLALAAIVLLLDQLTKYWVLNILKLREQPLGHIELSNVFDLTFVWNRGVSFGLFQADSILGRLLLSAFALGVMAVMVVWLWRAERRLMAVALGLIIGGAFGNLIDRLRFGAVVDFVDFSDIHFIWVFNVADASITIGVIVMLVDAFLVNDAQKSV